MQHSYWMCRKALVQRVTCKDASPGGGRPESVNNLTVSTPEYITFQYKVTGAMVINRGEKPYNFALRGM